MYPDEDRLYRLERKVDFLFQRMGINADDALADDGFGSPSAQDFGNPWQQGGLPSSFYDALGGGKTIEAIKIYRSATGAGLKEAKEAVEAMARDGS
jgi:hypothetical protein